MTLKSSLKRKRATPPASSVEKQNVRLATPQLQTTRALEKKWLSNGPTTRQTTLTQIDFVQRSTRAISEDLDLEYEDELPARILKKSRRPAKRVNTIPAEKIKRPSKIVKDEDKENDIFTIPIDDPGLNPQHFMTPRKLRYREVPSSQSPSTPLSTRSARLYRNSPYKSPLKEISVNVKRRCLKVEDTFKTSDTLSSPPSVHLQSMHCKSIGERGQSPSRAPGGEIRANIGSSELEILDSDWDLSDVELTRTSQSLQDDNSEDVTVMPEMLPSLLPPRSNISVVLQQSDAELLKPPISDDSRNESEARITNPSTFSDDKRPEESNTLDEALLTKPKRTYSNKRRISTTMDVSSSQNLEEMSEVGIASQKFPSAASHPTDMASSPPLASIINELSQSSVQHPAVQDPGFSFDNHPPVPSDSQQVTAQLEQESQWQPPLPQPSQATTASIHSSPMKDHGTANKSQSSSSRRGWFFNPLTDSQLLPDSIMNFELPRLPASLGGRFGMVEEDLEEES